MIVNGDECEDPTQETIFPCGCWLGVMHVTTGDSAGKWRLVLDPCDDECERAQGIAVKLAGTAS